MGFIIWRQCYKRILYVILQISAAYALPISKQTNSRHTYFHGDEEAKEQIIMAVLCTYQFLLVLAIPLKTKQEEKGWVY